MERLRDTRARMAPRPTVYTVGERSNTAIARRWGLSVEPKIMPSTADIDATIVFGRHRVIRKLLINDAPKHKLLVRPKAAHQVVHFLLTHKPETLMVLDYSDDETPNAMLDLAFGAVYGLAQPVNMRRHRGLDHALRKHGTMRGRHSGRRIVRVDRRTVWGNPYHMDGLKSDRARDSVCNRHAKWFDDEHDLHDPNFMKQLASLHGAYLACWCAPQRCHAEHLAIRAREAWLGLFWPSDGKELK